MRGGKCTRLDGQRERKNEEIIEREGGVQREAQQLMKREMEKARVEMEWRKRRDTLVFLLSSVL